MKQGKTRRTKTQNTRPTIGFLTASTWARVSPYPTMIWTGVADAVRERDANLICFTGGAVDISPIEFDTQRNVLYDLVTSDSVDGLVIGSGMLGMFLPAEEFQDFCDRYRPLPMVSIALALEGIPSVLVDNVTGLRDAVDHLIEVHGYRRIACLRGPEGREEPDARYRAYTEALTEHGLALNPDLVASGDFMFSSGAAMMRLLLDERKLRPGVDFEAVVAACDAIALGALEVLQARGVQVPYDVALVGFDDVLEARVATPTLTTVRQPIYEQAKRAVDMLFALLAGEEVPEQVTLPTEMVLRCSCGCHSQLVSQAAAEPVARANASQGRSAGTTFVEALVARREEIVAAMVQAVPSYAAEVAPATTTEWAGQVLDGFAAAMRDGSLAGFLPTLDRVLRQVAESGDGAIGDSAGSPYSSGQHVTAWQGALSALRSHLLPYLDDDAALARAENLWQQARVFTAEAAQQAQRHEELQAERQNKLLQQVGQALITTLNVEDLMDVIARELPGLGIPSAHISLYEHRPELAKGGQPLPPQECRLIMAYDEGDAAHPRGRIELPAGGVRFPFQALTPQGMLPQERRYTTVVEPLNFRDHQLGLALFEVGAREGAIYEVLREQISTALYGALLLQARKEAEAALELAYAKVEKKVQERTAELEQEVAKREAAQKESIALQQEVIEAQQRSIQELSTPIIPVMERVIVMPLIGSIDTLRAKDIMRRLLAGIREHQARVVILDITGVPLVDSGVAAHLGKSIKAARLKGARVIITGMAESVAETVVELGLDWTDIETMGDLRKGLRAALAAMGMHIQR